MMLRPFATLFLFLVLAAVPARAADIPTMSFVPLNSTSAEPRSQIFGVFTPFVSVQRTSVCGNNLMTGLTVHHDGVLVTGLQVRCRFVSAVGGVGDLVPVPEPILGRQSTRSRLLECESGRAVSGVRVRSGNKVDAVSIACATIATDFATLRSYTNDPDFGTGRGAVVNRGAFGPITSPVGGPGGFSNAFDCPTTHPFVHRLAAGVEAGAINAFEVSCGGVLAAPAAPTASQPDFTARTRAQLPVVTANGAADTFSVDVFNIGRTATLTLDHTVELVFSSLDVSITSMPASCVFISAGRVRCPLTGTTFTSGASQSLSFAYQARRARPTAPIIAVQTSYLVLDGNAGNNTYGFAVTVNP
jgi:hypothetical protein